MQTASGDGVGLCNLTQSGSLLGGYKRHRLGPKAEWDPAERLLLPEQSQGVGRDIMKGDKSSGNSKHSRADLLGGGSPACRTGVWA